MKDYYNVLDLPYNATAEEIRKAYRNMSTKYHPDKNGGSKYSEEIFKGIVEAYEFLSNPLLKEKYDSDFFKYNTNNFSKSTNFPEKVRNIPFYIFNFKPSKKNFIKPILLGLIVVGSLTWGVLYIKREQKKQSEFQKETLDKINELNAELKKKEYETSNLNSQITALSVQKYSTSNQQLEHNDYFKDTKFAKQIASNDKSVDNLINATQKQNQFYYEKVIVLPNNEISLYNFKWEEYPFPNGSKEFK
jgi:curved DNA-binding protein CbpA